MLTRRTLFLFLCALACICTAVPTEGQVSATPTPSESNPVQDIVRINTRVVFINTLVRDKKTGAPVTDLKLENFQVLDNDKPRKLSYFSNEGIARRPLALMLELDLSTSAILYLEKPEVMEQIIKAVSRLKPEDEIGVRQVWYEPQGPLVFQLRSKVVADLSRDRAQTFTALRGVQLFAKENLPQVKMLFSFKALSKEAWKTGIAGAATGMPAGPPPIIGTAAPDFEYMIDKAPQLARQRPDSQMVIMEVTDDLGAELLGMARKKAHALLDSSVIVSGMVVKRNLVGKSVNVFGTVMSPMMFARFHTISYYGRQTGGEVETVARPDEFAASIDRIVSGLTARYSLGFALDESERNDDRVHTLEVKVKSGSPTRNLVVSARRSYIPKAQR